MPTWVRAAWYAASAATLPPTGALSEPSSAAGWRRTGPRPPRRTAPPVSAYELAAWERSKGWAADLDRQLAAAGYRYDPETVEFVTFGANWVGCGATYPIQMARVFGLTHPIQRRFELSNPDWSPLLLAADPVEQNLPVGDRVLLYIFRNGHLGPMAATPSPDVRGRYLAQYWEGVRGIMAPAHLVIVDFPAGSVREVDLFGVEIGPRPRPVGGAQPRAGDHERRQRRVHPVPLDPGNGGGAPLTGGIPRHPSDRHGNGAPFLRYTVRRCNPLAHWTEYNPVA